MAAVASRLSSKLLLFGNLANCVQDRIRVLGFAGGNANIAVEIASLAAKEANDNTATAEGLVLAGGRRRGVH